VLRYLKAFAKCFELDQYIHLNTRVVSATPQSASNHGGDHQLPHWELTVQQATASSNGSVPCSMHSFEALVVCNGHYARPRVPPVPGMDSFPSRCEHSHSYRQAERYSGLRVVVIGAHASGAYLTPDACMIFVPLLLLQSQPTGLKHASALAPAFEVDQFHACLSRSFMGWSCWIDASWSTFSACTPLSYSVPMPTDKLNCWELFNGMHQCGGAGQSMIDKLTR
jgi:cation diffusion facilitator CzcD-associated flavoprotein CzcO